MTVAVHTTTSAQVLDEVTELQSTLERVMRSKLSNRVESEVLFGTGVDNHVEGLYHQATGILTGQAIPVERIGAAIVTMEDAGYAHRRDRRNERRDVNVHDQRRRSSKAHRPL